MSESYSSMAQDQLSAQEPVLELSGGAMLRRAREAQGLHIAALAVSLKVPVKKLEALETDRFDLLPDTVFVRALASSVCRALKIDPDPILARLPHTAAQPLRPPQPGINVPFRVSRDGVGVSFWDQFSKPLVLAVLVLLIGVLVLVLSPFIPLTAVTEATRVASTDLVFPVSPPAPVAENSAPFRSDTPDLASATAQEAVPISNSVSVVAPSSPTESATGASPAMVQGSGMTTGTVVFKSRGSSWVEVVDAGGTVQLRKTLSSGEVVGVSGVMPLAVVVGRADTTDVEVRGKPFDLTTFAKNNIARFEVK